MLLSKTTTITIVKVFATFAMRRNINLRCTWRTRLANSASTTEPRPEGSRRWSRKITSENDNEYHRKNTESHDAEPRRIPSNKRETRITPAQTRHHIMKKNVENEDEEIEERIPEREK